MIKETHTQNLILFQPLVFFIKAFTKIDAFFRKHCDFDGAHAVFQDWCRQSGEG